jgi:hypothetical protein
MTEHTNAAVPTSDETLTEVQHDLFPDSPRSEAKPTPPEAFDPMGPVNAPDSGDLLNWDNGWRDYG